MTSPALFNSVIRTEAEALADRLLPMTAEQVASLSGERLAELHRHAQSVRARLDYKDTQTDAEFSTIRAMRRLECMASAELEARKARAA